MARLLTDYVDVSPVTGEAVTGEASLRQSLRDILTTPIGARVMRRDYGSRTAELLGAPLNATTIAEVVAGTAAAIRKWEPRLILRRVAVREAAPGHLTVDLHGEVAGRAVVLEGVV